MAGDCGANVGKELFVVPGLLNEVFSACADGFNDVVDGAVGSDHDDRELGLALLDLRQQFKAALAGQGEVEQDKIVVIGLDHAQAFFAVGGHGGGVALKG